MFNSRLLVARHGADSLQVRIFDATLPEVPHAEKLLAVTRHDR